ncbi:hypothetical protein SAMN02745161_0793 [Halodesulfovibrio marinisediminis DSM 17456]|uniref:SurA N-terminal domain-containing protein n=2 Tax=Halodesulfovibrio marinisediminis TaxID=458711 RepID=A0A1N6E8L1_9BACT|nr:hypothetical protein SAMN02745161_0793 [Halodesulfovibrio marinisediminis DSM 17456]
MNYNQLIAQKQVTIGRAAITACIVLSLLLLPSFASATEKAKKVVQVPFSELIESAKNAGIQQDILFLMTQEVLEKKIDKSSATCLVSLLINAKKAGMPVSILEEKIREGRAKGVAGARISKAIKGMIEEMQFSKQLLSQKTGAEPQETDLRMMCEILSQGISRTQAENFVSSYADKKINIVLEGLRLYALLSQSGVSSHQLNEFTVIVMTDEAVLMRWRELPQLFSIVIRSDVTPNVFMSKAIQAVKLGTLPHNFARELSLQPRSLGVSEESSNDS